MIKFLDLKAVTAMHADEINAAVQRVVNSGWYLQGNENKAFTEEYARYIGTRYCVGCGNGLDALTLILRAYKEMGRLHDGKRMLMYNDYMDEENDINYKVYSVSTFSARY